MTINTTSLTARILTIIGLISVVAAMLIRIRFLEFPLERDEGEYAYMGSLILQGIAPYTESYNMKMPGIYAIYALIMALFGESVAGIKVGLMLFVAASTVFVFLIARRWFNHAGGCIAAAMYSVVSLLPEIQGISANAEQFLLPFALAGTWLVITYPSKSVHIILAGILLGTATMVKQHGVLFSVFAGVYLLFLIREPPWKSRLTQSILLGCGFLLPVVCTFTTMWLTGSFENFLFWTIQYALEYASQVPLSEGISLLVLRLAAISSVASLVMLFFVLGLFSLGRKQSRNIAPLVLLAFSLLATVPGFYFRPHYFILLAPALCLVSTAGILWSADKLSARMTSNQWLPVASMMMLVVCATLYSSRYLLLFAPLDQANRLIFGANPFVESQEIAAYIKQHTDAEDRIAVIGSEPQLYFHAGRRAATGYIYTYGLMEDQPFSKTMTAQMIEEIESAEPAMVVFVNVPNSWLIRPDSDRSIFSWSNHYLESEYKLTGQVLLGPDGATFEWDQNLPGEINLQRMGLFVYRRKS